jgi:hypothetical protein
MANEQMRLHGNLGGPDVSTCQKSGKEWPDQQAPGSTQTACGGVESEIEVACSRGIAVAKETKRGETAVGESQRPDSTEETGERTS